MEVRPAAAGDVEAIAEVHVRSWQEAYIDQVPQDFLDSLSVERRIAGWTNLYASTNWPAAGTLVLIESGAVVGFANVCPSRDDDAPPGIGELTAIYLRRAAWGHGGGRALMAAALSTLIDAGFEAATLWVLDSNERARRFYEADGWRLDGSDKLDTIGDQPVREVRYRRSLS